MITRALTVLIILVSGCQAAWSQDTLSTRAFIPKRAIKFSPFHLVNFYPTIELSYEQQLSQMLSVQIEGGYVLNYSSTNSEEFSDKRGFKTKLELRHYLSYRTDNRVNLFFAGEGYYNHVNFNRQRRTQECIDNNCNFRFERSFYAPMQYRESGVTGKFGWLIHMQRTFFDFSVGVTVRYIRYYGDEDDGPWGMDDMDFIEIPDERDRTTLSPNLGIRFGYRLE